MTDLQKIRTNIPKTELLAGLAEEAAELAQAALKYRRALDGTNPTPKSTAAAYADMMVELADVIVYLIALETITGVEAPRMTSMTINRIVTKKLERWGARLDAPDE